MQEEVQERMCPAVELLDEETMKSVSLTRSIPVRELRSKGWRTRTVHHFSEGGINNATRPAGRIVHQAVHHFIILLMMFMRMGMEPLMFKRDIRKAFRTIPICVKGFELAHVCFAFEGHYWACRQLGMLFGCAAAVLSFHRLRNSFEEMVRKKFMAAIARYVDDCFGAAKVGVRMKGGRVLSQMGELMGIFCDEAKSADDMVEMVVLGISTTILMAPATKTACSDR